MNRAEYPKGLGIRENLELCGRGIGPKHRRAVRDRKWDTGALGRSARGTQHGVALGGVAPESWLG